MENKIYNLIAKENKKQPYTDEKIAELLGMNREEITVMRQELSIPDSRERRRMVLQPDVEKILKKEGNISDRKLTQLLNDMGYEVSRFIAHSLKEECHIDLETSTSNEMDIKPDTYFRNLIGYDGSMKHQISQAQAAILYPPRGLHTLIHGPSGVGKSQLAECMYKFAVEVGTLKKESPFVIFNCADYADNSELLMSQLFGHVNGAFTGTTGDKIGLVEKANGGILFLDEVHRLPSEGQEMLFYLIDHGMYRRLGDSERMRKAQLLIIAATTEDLTSYLLTTFRRRIPMVIDLPSLSERGMGERYLIIKRFFYEEALRLDKGILIEKNAMKRLLSYPCLGNIGQLKSDIQVSCAKSFLKFIVSKQNQLTVSVEDLPEHVSSSSIRNEERDIKKYGSSDLIISNVKHAENKNIVEPDFYQFVEERYYELQANEYDEKEIIDILGNELNREMNHYLKNIEFQNYDMKRLEEIVGSKIIHTVKKSLDNIKYELPDISTDIIYPLCLHISASYERLKCGKIIMNPQVEKIKKEYAKEFCVARKIGDQITEDLQVILSDDEVAFIAMYLKTFAKEDNAGSEKIGIIVLTHGNVGIEMVKVANQLLNVNYAIGLTCELDESPANALDKVMRVVEKLDNGKGCLLLTDMGSLVTFGQIVSQRLGIDIRTISRVDTVMVIEAIRRALLEETSLDELERALNAEKAINFHGNNELEEKEPVIVAACLTGKGSAVLLQAEIQKMLNQEKASIRILTIGVASENGVTFDLDQISRSYHIIAIVGNFNIKYHNIPFFSTTEILNQSAKERFLETTKNIRKKETSSIVELLDVNIISCQDKDAYCKNDIIEKLYGMLHEHGYVSEDYLLDVYKREAMGGTIMKGVAIPHGFTEHVTKPAIAILTLNEPILWEEDFKTKIIFMPAFVEESLLYTNALFKLCSNTKLLEAICESTQAEDILQIMK